MNHCLTIKSFIHVFLLPEGAPEDPELTKLDK